MIIDIAAAVKDAKRGMEKFTNDILYMLSEYQEESGEWQREIDEIKVTGFRQDGDVINIVFEHRCGDIDETSMTDFLKNVYANRDAAVREIERRARKMN